MTVSGTNGDIVPPNLVIKAMRDSGYKSTAYALAELMDNAVQANADSVELLCGERTEVVNQRRRSRVNQIGVLDNGIGMDASVLRMALQFGNGTRLDDLSGIGRFGMGLPNSSISQARRVDVWSWQNGPRDALHTYLDIDEIESRQMRHVPEPTHSSIPGVWQEAGNTFDATGTLVVWSRLDRLMWRTSRAVIENSELVVGRMYRYFLQDGSVQIRFCKFDVDAPQDEGQREERPALPNDPLYLMQKTSCPEPYDSQPMFTQGGYEPSQFDIHFRGERHTVNVRFAYAKEEARRGYNPGSKPHGQHAARNAGVSIVRANRELDLDSGWTDPSEPRDRWWGVEVSFTPALDDLFGVTNNKQAARNFSELAKADVDQLLQEDQSYASWAEELDADNDPRLPLLEVAQHVKKNINTIRGLLKAQTATSTRQRHGAAARSEEKGTAATRHRIEEGFESETDRQEQSVGADEREKQIADELLEQGAPEMEASELAARTVKQRLKYAFSHAELGTPAFFDVKSRGGALIVSLNTEHPAYNRLVEVLRDSGDGEDEETLRSRLRIASNGLELLLMAWARYEDEQPDGVRRERAQESRWDWGRMAREFLQED